MGTSRAWLGGFGELSKRDIYTWKRYNTIETVTYFWNMSTVSYAQTSRNGLLAGTNLAAMKISGGGGSGIDLNGYIATNITWDPGKFAYVITADTREYTSVSNLISSRSSIYLNSVSYSLLYGTDGTPYTCITSIPSQLAYSTTSLVDTVIYSFGLLANRNTSGYIGISGINGLCSAYRSLTIYERIPVAGTYLREVSSTNQTAYPDNGVYNGNFYTKQSKTESAYSQGTYIDTVESESPDAYPINGVYNGYWYVKE